MRPGAPAPPVRWCERTAERACVSDAESHVRAAVGVVDALSEVVGDEESGKTQSQLLAEYDDLFGSTGGDRATNWTRTTADYPRV